MDKQTGIALALSNFHAEWNVEATDRDVSKICSNLYLVPVVSNKEILERNEHTYYRYAGARCIVGKIPELGYKTDKSIFPVEFIKLDALYLEDFFFVMKNELVSCNI